jgi:hypothetical protein
MKGKFKLLNNKCVNSNWIANWLASPKQESCQCGFKCKVSISIERNGHAPYNYIVDKSEYKKVQKENINHSEKELIYI